MKKAIVIILAFVVCSCGLNHKFNKAKKLIAEIEAKGKVVDDTVKTKKKVKGDSASVKLNTKDTTIYSYKDSLVYNKKDTTVYHFVTKTVMEKMDTTVRVNGIDVHIKLAGKKLTVNAKCPDKEIEVDTAINRTITCPPNDHTWKIIALTAIGILLIVLYIAIKK